MNHILSYQRDYGFTDTLLLYLMDVRPSHDPCYSSSRSIISLLLLSRALIPHLIILLQPLVPPWVSVCTVIALMSYAGNLDRKWWLYGVTGAALSPIAYRTFWPLRDLCRDDETVAERTLTAIALLLATAIIRSRLYASLALPFAPSHGIIPTIPEPAMPKTEIDDPESIPEPLTYLYAKRPKWPLRIRPLKLSPQYLSSGCCDSCHCRTVEHEQQQLGKMSWSKLRARSYLRHAATQNVNSPKAGRLAGLGEANHVRPSYPQHTMPSPVGTSQPMDDVVPSTPEWAKVDRMPPTPLSAAKLEHFVATKEPSPVVL